MHADGKRISSVAISNITTQTALVAAPGASKRIVVIGWTVGLDAAGEFQFHSAAGNALTGAVEVLADTPVTSETPLVCNANEALNLTCTTGAGNGVVAYIVESV